MHLRHLRQILRISWKDYIPNVVEVLRRANMSIIESTPTDSQLRWTGHIIRMKDSRPPKAVFCGELAKGKHLHGEQRLREKDVVRRHLKATYFAIDTGRLLHKIDNSGGRPFTMERAILKNRYHKNTNMITISAMAFQMLLHLASSVSTVAEPMQL